MMRLAHSLLLALGACANICDSENATCPSAELSVMLQVEVRPLKEVDPLPAYVTRECKYTATMPSHSDVVLLSYPAHAKFGEMHSDLREEITSMPPSVARQVLELASPHLRDDFLMLEADSYDGIPDAPENLAAKCTLRRFVQYAICAELQTTWVPPDGKWTAFSFGGNGYDDWSNYIKTTFNVVPDLFDCFDPRAVEGTRMHKICIGGATQRAIDARKDSFMDLYRLLQDKPDRSVLMKIDIESSEWQVLTELPVTSLRKIASLTVEYHFMTKMGSRCCGMEKVKELFERLAQEFIVVDGSAMRWGNEADCGIEGGYKWPNALSVSYVSKSFALQTGVKGETVPIA